MHLLAGGSLIGFALALNSALQRHRSDPRLRSERQLRAITGASRPLVVPRLTEAVRLQQGWLGASSARATSVPTFALTNPDAAASVALARLTAELDARSGGVKPLVVLVTAIGDLEGKSTVAVNAALAAARAGDKVLLIDADARNRGVSRLLPGGEALPGLFDIANGTVLPGQAIVKSKTYPLDILPAGQVSDARHPRLQDPIAELAKPYDLVVIDGGVLIRDRHVAEFAGGASQVVLVARDGVTLRADYQSAFEILDRSGRVRPVLLTDK